LRLKYQAYYYGDVRTPDCNEIICLSRSGVQPVWVAKSLFRDLLCFRSVKPLVSATMLLVTNLDWARVVVLRPISIYLSIKNVYVPAVGALRSNNFNFEELDGPAYSALRRAIAEAKQNWSVIEWVTKNLLSLVLRAFEGTLSRRSRLHLQSLPPTNPH
jgi:hypothetical protein